MKILLFGKNGQVGAEIIRGSKSFNYKVTALSKKDIDIVDTKKVEQIINRYKPHIIINATAYHALPTCEKYPQKAFSINTIAIKTIAEICSRYNIQLVHYSTDYVFDGLKGKPYSESDIPNPLQIYGISKLAGEIAALQYNKNTLIIRTSAVFGGKFGSRIKKGNFVLTILKQARKNTALAVTANEIVSPTYAVDLAKATLQLVEKKVTPGIYHLINEGYCSWADFAEEIVKSKKISCKILPVNKKVSLTKPQRPSFSALVNTKAKVIHVTLPGRKNALSRYLKTIR